MKAVATSAGQLHEASRRLDASYHASEGVKALRFMRRWARQAATPQVAAPRVLREKAQTKYGYRRVEPLVQVCIPNGIFIGGRSRRIYVTDPDHGIPFLSSSDMLLASFDGVKLVSKQQPDLESMILNKGWTLISRSGTIGNVAYVREDMNGLAGSEHIMRVVPDPQRIPPGYVYAFLSSPLGNAIVKSGTFGTIVDTIAPHQVGAILIPRLDLTTEEHIHELIERAAALRSDAQKGLDRLVQQLNEKLGIPEGYRSRWPYEWSYDVKVVRRHNNLRLDPFHYAGHAVEYHRYLKPGPRLGDIATVHLPGQFKRMYVGPQGVPYLSGVDLYQLKVAPRLWLSHRQPELPELVVSEEGTILVQADGQRYGILGRPVYVDRSIVGAAISNHLVRIRPRRSSIGGYIHLFLSTKAGRRELIRHSYGTSIPTIPVQAFEELCISHADTDFAQEMGSKAVAALRKRTQANQLEGEAQTQLVEALGYR